LIDYRTILNKTIVDLIVDFIKKSVTYLKKKIVINTVIHTVEFK